jgi:hypothetical protein
VKIISGGQTGVDRAALDIALKHGINCGGWCPAERLDEFGRIPDRYPLRELKRGGPNARTRQNVKDSDGTVLIYFCSLHGGTDYTLWRCIKDSKPYVLLDAAKTPAKQAGRAISDFVRKHNINILNVAGPRQSEWPEGYQYAAGAVEAFLKL